MKKWYQSKTVVLNAVSIAVAVLMFISTNNQLDGTLKELIIAVVGVLNIILRWGGNATPISKKVV